MEWNEELINTYLDMIRIHAIRESQPPDPITILTLKMNRQVMDDDPKDIMLALERLILVNLTKLENIEDDTYIHYFKFKERINKKIDESIQRSKEFRQWARKK